MTLCVHNYVVQTNVHAGLCFCKALAAKLCFAITIKILTIFCKNFYKVHKHKKGRPNYDCQHNFVVVDASAD